MVVRHGLTITTMNDIEAYEARGYSTRDAARVAV
jgi:hypothetical protein